MDRGARVICEGGQGAALPDQPTKRFQLTPVSVTHCGQLYMGWTEGQEGGSGGAQKHCPPPKRA